MKKFGEYHDLLVQINALLLADVFNNFLNMCLEIYGNKWSLSLHTGSAWYSVLTAINRLLIIGKGIRGRICHAIHRYAEANDRCIKGYDENKESLYLNCWYVNNLYWWGISQKMFLTGLKILLNLIKVW